MAKRNDLETGKGRQIVETLRNVVTRLNHPDATSLQSSVGDRASLRRAAQAAERERQQRVATPQQDTGVIDTTAQVIAEE